MELCIENQHLSLTVDTLGAQFMHLCTKDSCEYLWQGDPKYWADRSPLLFPFIGRLTDNRYRFLGKEYPMGIHGFAAASEFAVEKLEQDAMQLLLQENAHTLAQYPFAFSLRVIYRLVENAVAITYEVENHSDTIMPFGIGGHPGFRVPLEEGEDFSQYKLTFSHPCQPDRVGFTPAVYLSGEDRSYPLEEGNVLPLQHDLFDEDAIILKNMARQVTLQGNGSRSITLSYPDMPYLGIWHWPKTDAPYVCIEPWSSLPARQDIVEEFACKSDMLQLHSHDVYRTTWTITIT